MRHIALGVGEGISSRGKASRLTQGVADTAVYLISNRMVEGVLFAGGFGYRFKERPPTTEAELMRDRAQMRGVESSKIMIEPNSHDTVSNLYTSKKRVIAEGGISEITLIASWQHLYRTRVFAEMMYGPQYKINCISSPDNIWGEELIVSLEAERLSLDFALGMWEWWGVKRGDHEHIWKVLNMTHPFYTNNPILSEKQIDMMQRIDELRKSCRKFSEDPET